MSSYAPRCPLRLTPRDIEILRAVYRYDGLFSVQIRRRFWSQNGHQRTYLERLAALIAAGYLRAVPLPSDTGRGSGQRLIVLGRASHPLLTELEGLTPHDIRQIRHAIVPALWRHERAVRDVRLSLDLACQAHPLVELTDWVTDAEFHRTPIKLRVPQPEHPERVQTVELVPDGRFTLELSTGQSKTCFLEVDQDTEQTPGKLKSRLRAYFGYVGAHLWPVLWVVPNRRRADKLARWIAEEAAACGRSPALFAVTTVDQIDERRALTHPIWQVVGMPDPLCLLPSSSPASSPTLPQQLSQTTHAHDLDHHDLDHAVAHGLPLTGRLAWEASRV